jgi:hypothetical protein
MSRPRRIFISVCLSALFALNGGAIVLGEGGWIAWLQLVLALVAAMVFGREWLAEDKEAH